MDPNKMLRLARTQANRVVELWHRDPLAFEEAMALAEAFKALDQWLTRGGFVPDDWVGLSPALYDEQDGES